MSADQPAVLQIRKYPNRRFYDASRSRHVKLEELHELVRGGQRIQVTDPQGRDITNQVLTQILLEHDAPKLELFPVALLHQALQANQQVFRRFVDEYFARAMDAFLASKQQFDAFLVQAGLSPLTAGTPFDWAQAVFRAFGGSPAAALTPFGQAQSDVKTDSAAGAGATGSGSAAPAGATEGLEDLRRQVAELRAELASTRKPLRAQRAPGGRRKAVKRSRRVARK